MTGILYYLLTPSINFFRRWIFWKSNHLMTFCFLNFKTHVWLSFRATMLKTDILILGEFLTLLLQRIGHSENFPKVLREIVFTTSIHSLIRFREETSWLTPFPSLQLISLLMNSDFFMTVGVCPRNSTFSISLLYSYVLSIFSNTILVRLWVYSIVGY